MTALGLRSHPTPRPQGGSPRDALPCARENACPRGPFPACSLRVLSDASLATGSICFRAGQNARGPQLLLCSLSPFQKGGVSRQVPEVGGAPRSPGFCGTPLSPATRHHGSPLGLGSQIMKLPILLSF